MNLTRRTFLGFGTALASGATVGFTTLFTRNAKAVGFGPMILDPNGRLDLPEGFKYQILQTAGDMMSDGNAMRAAPDGMATFPGSRAGEIILMRNHELTENGGVSRLVIDASDPANLTVTRSNDVLGGTSRNCAGGPSPWGWLSCEEEIGGGVWLCPQETASLLVGEDRVRIHAYGSFRHEAVAIDPDTLIAYLTEDDGDSFLYRMVPYDAATDPFSGQLQAMKRVGVDAFNTAGMTPGESIQIEWVDVSASTPRSDAQAAGATVVVRGEGIWWFDGVAYFSATSNGQVFELEPNAANTGGTLTLLADTLDAPDNITVAPWGDLFVAEDNGRANHIRIVDGAGGVIDFARNRLEPGVEFSGVCFSPDGKVLFVNMQGRGMTFAITGPFPDVLKGGSAGGAGGTAGSSGTAGGATPAGGGGNAAGGMANSGGTSNTSGAPSTAGAAGAAAAGAGGTGVGGAGGTGVAAGGNTGRASSTGDGSGCSVPGGRANTLGGLVLAGAVGALALLRRAATRGDSASFDASQSEEEPIRKR
jgi:secreted PhoX family phosphatase